MLNVRDGQQVWPTCSECGCRLFYHRLWGSEYLAHKLISGKIDAKGHECPRLVDWWPVDEETKKLMGVIGV